MINSQSSTAQRPDIPISGRRRGRGKLFRVISTTAKGEEEREGEVRQRPACSAVVSEPETDANRLSCESENAIMEE